MSRYCLQLGCVLACLWFLGACTSSPEPVKVPTLRAPGNANPSALSAMREGNRLFASGQWGPAKSQYESAIQSQPELAEAHYNLALTLDRMGNREKARDHYMEAANLAPGHAVIWNSPVLRRYGDVKVEKKANSSSQPVMPGLGGIGGGGGRSGPPGGY